MKTAVNKPAPGILPGAGLTFKIINPMYEQFIAMTDQLFWEGYAEQLAKENPERFQQELNAFFETYFN